MNTMNTAKFCLLSIGLATAFAVAGCGGSYREGYVPPVMQTPPVSESFTNWSKKEVFAKSETDTPAAPDALTFNFDGDDNPDAYIELLPPL